MNEFIEKLKNDRNLQLILGGSLILIFIVFLFLRPIIFPKKNKSKSNLPCYPTTLKIWVPFNSQEFFSFLQDASIYCLKFEVEQKSIDEIKRELPLSLVENRAPDIVYIDNDTLKKYEQIFNKPRPITVDALVAYYNENILNFLNLPKPRTLNELQNFIQKVKEYDPNFYVIGLGTDKIKYKTEIILSLLTMFENYQNKQDREGFISILKNAFLSYSQFSDPLNSFYSYPLYADEDIINFAYEKLAIFIGFYEDKKELIKMNPNLKFIIGYFPLNTFPPKVKVYSKIYYLAPLKNNKPRSTKFLIDWFISNKLLKFSDQFDLVPYGNFPDLTEEKKIVADSAQKFGETFDFLNKEKLFEKIDFLIKTISNSQLFEKALNEVYYSL